MDFIEGLPNSNGHTIILVIVDRFTKYSHFYPIKHPFTASTIAQVFMDNIVKLHGTPKSIVSDRDEVFTSSFWSELFKLLKTDLKLSSAYHPQSDGQTERVNQYLEMFLRCAVQETPKQWTKWLSLAELWYNTCFHSSLQCSPFKALSGVDPSPCIIPTLKHTDHQDVSDMLKERQLFTELLKEQLAKAQNRMKLYADKKRSEHSFLIGEHVLLKLQPYTQHSVVNRSFPMLAYKYYGPYEVIEKIGSVAYKLKLPDGNLIHHVFHVSQIKSFTADYSPIHHSLLAVPALDVKAVAPELILDRRLVKKGNDRVEVPDLSVSGDTLDLWK
jgi:hypothetical protein